MLIDQNKIILILIAINKAKPVEFVQQDDNSRRWLNDFRTKAYSAPISFESVDGNNYFFLKMFSNFCIYPLLPFLYSF